MPDLRGPGTRYTRWRLRSRWCAAADGVMAAASGVLIVVVLTDDIVSWPSNRVLVTDHDLAHWAGVIIVPCWIWLLGSYLIVTGVDRRNGVRPFRRPRPQLYLARLRGRPWAAAAVAAALLCIALVCVGFGFGAAKGSAQVLPGPRYEVSTLDGNQGPWTAVSAVEYQAWQARYVREDGLFVLFGLVLVAGGVNLLRWHRAARQN
jgi:hypothetical protein